MTSQSNSVLTSSLKSFSRASSLIVIAIGCLVLLGWILDIVILKSVFPGLVTMKANTALAFVLLGISLWLLQPEQAEQRARRIAHTCAAIAALIGLVTLVEYLFGLDLGIDQLLFRDFPIAAGTSFPGRMSLPTAVNFLLLGLALLLLDVESGRGRRSSELLAIITTMVGLLAAIGYSYGAEELYSQHFYSYTGMAVHTAAAFLALSIGVLCARPDREVTAIFSRSSLGGLTARRLLPAAVLIVFGLGWLRLVGEQAGLYATEFGLALMATLSIAALTIVIMRAARLLDQTEAERRQEEAKFRDLIESTPDAIFAVDKNGIIVLLNSQTEKIFGYSRGELIGQSVETLVPERFRELHLGHRAKYSSEPRARPMGTGLDLYGRRKDGSEFPIDISLSPLKSSGEILGGAILRDVTDRKLTEKALQARYEELYVLHEIGQTVLTSLDLKSILEGILDKTLSICSFDIGVIRLLDPRSKSLQPVASRGYRNPGDVNPHSIEAKDPTVGKIQTAAFSSSGAYTVENVPATPGLRTLKREGAHTAILIPVRAENQVLGTILLASRTPRKFLPQEVRLLETLASQLGIAVQKARLFEVTKQNLEHITVLREIDKILISTLDLDAILSLLLEKIDSFLSYPFVSTIMLLSRETHELEPAACRHLDEKEWRKYFSEPTHGRGNQWTVLETKAPLKVLNVQTHPQTRHPGFMGRHGLVSFLGVPLTAKGETLGVLSIYAKEEHDFTDEEVGLLTDLANQASLAIHNAQLYEEMSKLAANLSKANTVKDQFLSVMSHELRTPLNVVMGYTGMIKDGILGDINPQQEDALDKVLNRANEQLTMINNVLYATVIETEKVKAEMVEVDLGDFLSNLRTAYHGPINKHLTLNWDYPPNLPVIKTDSAKLKQILQNLINNAIKFTEKGNVTVSARVVKEAISDQPPAISHQQSAIRNSESAISQVEFKVADTGVGIAKEHLPIIFEKFHQVDSSETRLFGGVGMGLYIVNKLTELLRGKVEVESEPGEGSTFTVTLPLGVVSDDSQADQVDRLHKGERL